MSLRLGQYFGVMILLATGVLAKNDSSEVYTSSFYYAWGFGLLGFLILLILLISFFLRPKNKWGKSKSPKRI